MYFLNILVRLFTTQEYQEFVKKKKEKKNKLDSSRLQFIAEPAEFVAVIYTVAKRITFLGSAMFVAD